MAAGVDDERPRLKPWYRLATTDAGVTARFGSSVLLFEGSAAQALLPGLLPLLDGTRTLDELAATLGPRTRPAIENVLALLAAHDLLLRAEPPPGAAGELVAATAWEVRDPARAHVSVLGDGETRAEIARLLRASGVGRVGSGWDAELVVAAPDEEPATRLDEWNAIALERNVPLLPVVPFDGTIATVGPLLVPRETACFTCLTLRRHGDPHAARERPFGGRHLSSPALRSLCAALAATAAVRWLTTGDAAVVGAILAVEYETQLVGRHPVYRVPRCPSCSPLATAATLAPWGRADAVAA